jgi:hypothetical protein
MTLYNLSTIEYTKESRKLILDWLGSTSPHDFRTNGPRPQGWTGMVPKGIPIPLPHTDYSMDVLDIEP